MVCNVVKIIDRQEYILLTVRLIVFRNYFRLFSLFSRRIFAYRYNIYTDTITINHFFFRVRPSIVLWIVFFCLFLIFFRPLAFINMKLLCA